MYFKKYKIIILIFEHMCASSGAFFNGLEAFLEVASMRKVSTETLVGTENQLYEVEKCREHVHFEAPKS